MSQNSLPEPLNWLGRGAGPTLPWAQANAFLVNDVARDLPNPGIHEALCMRGRRLSKRLPSILEGRARLEPQAPQIVCTIRNLSLTGAQLWFPEAMDLPEEFELEVPMLRQAIPVRLMWSKAKTHGVMFLAELRPPGDDAGLRLLEQLRTSHRSD